MYVFYSRDIQNMKEKCGAYGMLYKDQWSSLSLVRATRSWAQSDKTARPRAATKAQAEILTGYGSFQFLPQNPLALLLTFGFLSSVPRDHHPHVSLPAVSTSASIGRDAWEVQRVNISVFPRVAARVITKKSWAWYAGKQNCCGKAGVGRYLAS